MSNKTLLEYYETLDAVIDYLETCASENRDINGESMLLFPTVQTLVETYLDEVSYTAEQLKMIVDAAVQNEVIVSTCQSIN